MAVFESFQSRFERSDVVGGNSQHNKNGNKHHGAEILKCMLLQWFPFGGISVISSVPNPDADSRHAYVCTVAATRPCATGELCKKHARFEISKQILNQLSGAEIFLRDFFENTESNRGGLVHMVMCDACVFACGILCVCVRFCATFWVRGIFAKLRC